MRKVELTVNEQKKYEVIKKLVETDGNKNRAAKTLGGDLYCSINGCIYCLDEIPEQELVSRYFYGKDESQKKQKRKRYIPPMDHPMSI